jgi:membrane fusion protein, multidrug efflux system
MNDPASSNAPAGNLNDSAQSGGNGRRRRILSIIAAVFATLAILWTLLWLLVLSRRETTDDAYVAGDQIGVSAQTAGTVVDVLADDTQRVDSGQVLVRLDPTDNLVALARAAGSLSLTVRQIRQQSQVASQYDAQVASRQIELQQAEAELARRQPLLAQQAIAAEELQRANTAVDMGRAALLASTRAARGAHAPLEGASLDVAPAVLEARAAFVQAWIAARRSTVRAPSGGYVARRNVQVGQRVVAGQTLLTIIPLDKLWVDANFKEGQLRALRIGQDARIAADLYGGDVTFHGRVVGMSAGTGAAFSLLPAQNATGNWIKVVQRVPVRIALEAGELAQHPLRVGLSTHVNVDTHRREGAVLASAGGQPAVATTNIYADDYQAAQRAADALIRGEPLITP